MAANAMSPCGTKSSSVMILVISDIWVIVFHEVGFEIPAPPESPLQWRHNENDGVSTWITSLTMVYSRIYSGADQRKHQSSASLAFVCVCVCVCVCVGGGGGGGGGFTGDRRILRTKGQCHHAKNDENSSNTFLCIVPGDPASKRLNEGISIPGAPFTNML